MNKIDLDGRVAIVTGGAQGFGRAIVQRFVASGARVAIWDFDAALAEKTAKEIGGDVRNTADVNAFAKRIGKVDILLNAAGFVHHGTILDCSEEDFDFSFDLIICCKAIVPEMLKQKYGRIVNIASIAGKEGNPNASHYSASKAGLIALTKSLGKELAAHDILVNAVTPAAAKTAIFDQMTQQHIDFMLSKIPKGRFVLVEELAAMAAWLASEDCAFSTGAVFDISGGRATY